MPVRLARTFDVQTNSIALPPTAPFVAYINKGVVFDDGKKRFLRGSEHRLTKGDGQVVRVATDDAIVFTDTKHVSVVTLDGVVRELAPADRHVPIEHHPPTHTLTFTLGARVLQYDTRTWERRRSIDVGEDLDVSAFNSCSADEDWIVLQYGARIAVLNDDGEVEITLAGEQRGAPQVCPGGRMLAAYHHGEQTLVSHLPRDDDREIWDGWSWTRYCHTAGEFRGVHGDDLLIRVGEETSRHSGMDAAGRYAMFADGANRCVRWQYHAKSFQLFEW